MIFTATKTRKARRERKTKASPTKRWSRQLRRGSALALCVMNKYRVLLNGRNFLLDLGDDGLAPHGFSTTRFVEAETSDEAELNAVASVRKREEIKAMLRNSPDTPPMLFAEEIETIENFDGIEPPEQGIIWYKEDADK